MNNFEPQASWTNNDARCKVERAHTYLAVMYGIGAALLILALVFGAKDMLIESLIWIGVLLALIFGHLKTRNGIEDGKGWAILTSGVLMVLPLFAFPIGTGFAIYAYFNLAKLSPAQGDSEEPAS